jgi:hypothetical protein
MLTYPHRPKARSAALLRGAGLGVCCLALAACGPDYNAVANRLRESNIKQERELASLKEQLTNRDATIRDLRQQSGAPVLPTLPPERLAQLITAAKIAIQSGTDTWDNGDGKGVSAFRVYLRPSSADGQIVPATGTLTIDAFELPPSPAEPRRIGTWHFTPEQMKGMWYSGLGLNHFAFTCPWDKPPTQPQVTFNARFQDALTGQTLEATLTKRITLPPNQ